MPEEMSWIGFPLHYHPLDLKRTKNEAEFTSYHSIFYYTEVQISIKTCSSFFNLLFAWKISLLLFQNYLSHWEIEKKILNTCPETWWKDALVLVQSLGQFQPLVAAPAPLRLWIYPHRELLPSVALSKQPEPITYNGLHISIYVHLNGHSYT